MQPLRFFVLLATIAGLRAYDLSPALSEFYCVMNGYFSDTEQVQSGGENRTLSSVRVQPVLAPELSQLPVLYFEMFNNNVLARALVLVVSQLDDKTVQTIPYNFTGNMDITPGTFDANTIKSLTWKDLQGNPDCKDSYTMIGSYVTVVNWDDCKEEPVHGQRASYAVTLTCTDGTVVMPVGAAEISTLKPYVYKRRGNKYPLENAPGNYTCACDNTSD